MTIYDFIFFVMLPFFMGVLAIFNRLLVIIKIVSANSKFSQYCSNVIMVMLGLIFIYFLYTGISGASPFYK